MCYINERRNTVVLYPNGTCNLNCKYCTIDKNPVLKEIDLELDKSFQGDYYFNQIKKYFPRKDQLLRMETWGGEPFLRMDRIYNTLQKCIEYYPFFSTLYSSTNFSYDNWLNQFMGLMQILAKYSYRHFNFELQLSVDGPEYINDTNRGKGVTKKCIENFDKLIQLFNQNQFPENITLHCAIKGTWDLNCIHILNNKEKLIEFFQFYEDNFIEKVRKRFDNNITIGATVPNLAVPSPATQADGIIFSELIQKCREIEIENKLQHYFKYYTIITPFDNEQCKSPYNTYCYGSCGCGSGASMVGLLPYNLISICHEGYTEIVDEYKKYANKRDDTNMTVNIDKFFNNEKLLLCTTEEEYILHEKKMECYLNENSTARFASSVNLILALAMAGQIDSKYLNENEALKAAKYIYTNVPYCIKCNYRETGSFTMEHSDTYKLLLNGAMDFLTNYDTWFKEYSNENQ